MTRPLFSKARAGRGQDDWTVTISFTESGQRRFTDLTRRSLSKQVAILVDTQILMAPRIMATITGDVEISLLRDKNEAKAIAAAVSGSTLDVDLTVSKVDVHARS